MSKKLGRPKTPKSEAKTVLLGAFVDPQEAKNINRAIAESGQSKSEWIRSSWTQAARPIWVICKKWQSSDLEKKTVQFKITSPEWTFSGRGCFHVRHHQDRIRIAIEIESTVADGWKRLCRVLYLPQNLVDCIEQHPDATVAEFCCFGSTSGVLE